MGRFDNLDGTTLALGAVAAVAGLGLAMNAAGSFNSNQTDAKWAVGQLRRRFGLDDLHFRGGHLWYDNSWVLVENIEVEWDPKTGEILGFAWAPTAEFQVGDPDDAGVPMTHAKATQVMEDMAQLFAKTSVREVLPGRQTLDGVPVKLKDLDEQQTDVFARIRKSQAIKLRKGTKPVPMLVMDVELMVVRDPDLRRGRGDKAKDEWIVALHLGSWGVLVDERSGDSADASVMLADLTEFYDVSGRAGRVGRAGLNEAIWIARKPGVVKGPSPSKKRKGRR